MRLRSWLRNVKFDPTGELATTIAIAALAIAGPTAGLLWFMHRSLQGERQTLLAERATERKAVLAEVHGKVLAELRRLAGNPLPARDAALSPGLVFKSIVDSGAAENVVVLDGNGGILFPQFAKPLSRPVAPTPTEDAMGLIRDFHQPVKNFSDGFPQLLDRLRGRRLLAASAPSGRLLGAQVNLAAIQQMTAAEAANSPLVKSMKEVLLDYAKVDLPSTQRIFLAHELKAKVKGFNQPYIAAERNAVTVAEALTRSPPGIYEQVRTDATLMQVRAFDAPLVLIFSSESLRHSLEQVASAVMSRSRLRAEVVTVAANVPDEPDIIATSASLSIGMVMKGWRLFARDDQGIALIDSLVSRRRWNYTAIAIGGSILLNVLAAMAIQRFTRTASLTQARQDFLSVLSHELRTPLTSIRMFVDTLNDGGLEDPARARTYLDFIRRENERLSRLTENFLTFTRLESGKMNFDLQEVAPEDVAESARVAVQTRFAVEGTDFQVSVERKLPPIMADQTLLTQALLNLLENAFKYTHPEGKKILLAVSRGHNTVRFTVADNGRGLTAEDLKRIGQKFYRPDEAARSGQPGFGLGLSIVTHIINAHHGRLEINTEPGLGSRFTLIVPAETTPATTSHHEH